MKKISKILALFLVLLMVASLGASCKKKTDDGGAAVDVGENGEVLDENGNVIENPNSDDTGSGGNTSGGGGGTTSGGSDDGKGGTGGGEDKNKGQAGGSVGSSTNKYTVNEDGVINEVVTNDNEVIPDDEQGQAKSERIATEQSKYDFDRNPLINNDRLTNKEMMPSFAIDDTAFVRSGTKLADLKGKTVVFFTADNFAAWSYRNNKGETIDEWTWFKLLKSEWGLNVKYTVNQHAQSTNNALAAMNAGKQLDIVYSNHVVFPMSISISRTITDFVNINNLGSSPGVCKRTMDLCQWGGSLRLISPIGCVDVLWYNQTMAQELGLPDPHIQWENGKWNWDTFKNFLVSAPKTTKAGKNLTAFVQWPHNASYIWPSTNGCVYIEIDTENRSPSLINRWNDPKTLAAWEFITGVSNSIAFGSNNSADYTGENDLKSVHLGLYEGTTLMSATMYTQVYRDTEYSKNVQINWVPYPKSTTGTGQEICQYYGFGMMLPKKTIKEDNVPIALKFAELWATRFTEAIFDNLQVFEYYSLNYKQRKQYFDFVVNNEVFGLAMNDFAGSTVGTDTSFFKCFSGDPSYNVKTEATKASNLVTQYIKECMSFGK